MILKYVSMQVPHIVTFLGAVDDTNSLSLPATINLDGASRPIKFRIKQHVAFFNVFILMLPDSHEVHRSTGSMGIDPLQQIARPPPPAKHYFGEFWAEE